VPTYFQVNIEEREEPKKPTGMREYTPDEVEKSIKDLPWDRRHRKVSIIIPSRNEEIEHLQKTVDTIIKNTGKNVLEEIIIVDDASDVPVRAGININDGISLDESQDPNFIRIIRNPTRTGVVRSKIRGAKAAMGVVLVFFDAHVAPQPHWLAPLLRMLNTGKKVVAQPQVIQLDPDTWKLAQPPGDDRMKKIFDWKLGEHWVSDGNNEVALLSGGIFAITKEWWVESGEYDPEYVEYGRENLEQSVRVWLCGGEIRIASESLVGHMEKPTDRLDIDKNVVVENELRAIAMWWNDVFWSKYFEYFPDREKRANELRFEMRERASKLKKRLQCEDFTHYTYHFYDSFQTLGLLEGDIFSIQTHSGNCVEQVSNDKLEARNCDKSKASQKFSWIFGNGIQNNESLRCLDAANPSGKHSKLITFFCNRENTNQEWFLQHGRLSSGSYCVQIKGDKHMGPLEVVTCNDAHGVENTFKLKDW